MYGSISKRPARNERAPLCAFFVVANIWDLTVTNLLIVAGLAIIIYTLSLLLLSLTASVVGSRKILWGICIQIVLVLCLSLLVA